MSGDTKAGSLNDASIYDAQPLHAVPTSTTRHPEAPQITSRNTTTAKHTLLNRGRVAVCMGGCSKGRMGEHPDLGRTGGRPVQGRST